MSAEKTAIDPAAYAAALLAIHRLRTLLATASQSINEKIPSPHKGKSYEKAARRFAKHIGKVDKKLRSDIDDVAGNITALHGEGWDKKPEIVVLWHELAQTLTGFSEHPDKKVASVIVGKTNELQAWGVNKIPDGAPRRRSYYVVKVRKDYILCSERMALASVLGVGIDAKRFAQNAEKVSAAIRASNPGLPKSERREIVKRMYDQTVRQEIRAMSDRIVAIAGRSTALRDSIMLSTITPCEACAHALVAARPRAIFTDAAAGRHFTRSIDAGRDLLHGADIKIIDVKDWVKASAPKP